METLDIYLSGEVWDFQDPESLSYGVISKAAVQAAVEKGLKDTTELIVLHLHTPGGLVSEGFAIYDYLKGLAIQIDTIIEGQCMSIGTVLFLAGKNRTITENSKFLIHNPWGFVEGDADKMEEAAESFRKEEDRLANFYAGFISKSKDEILDLMSENKEITATEAESLGFATQVKEVAALASIHKNKNYNPMSKELKDQKGIIKNLETKVAQLLKKLNISTEAKALSVELADGGAIEVDTEAEDIAVGDAVEAEDGDYPLADGRTVTVSEGVITAITEAETVEDAEALAAQVAELTTANEALVAQVADLTTINSEVAEGVEEMQEEIQALYTRLGEKKSIKPQAKKETKFVKNKPAEGILTKDDMRARRDDYKQKAKASSLGSK